MVKDEQWWAAVGHALRFIVAGRPWPTKRFRALRYPAARASEAAMRTARQPPSDALEFRAVI